MLANQEEARRLYLIEKYNDAMLVAKLMDRSIWVDQTAEQLLDSIGRPSDIDQKVLKTKKKEVWKYYPNGIGRYRLRITLDNDVVVGWDEKL